jgi:hypothetical protein
MMEIVILDQHTILSEQREKLTGYKNEDIDPKGKYYDPRIAYLLHFWHYYLTWLSIFVHLAVMEVCLSSWFG